MAAAARSPWDPYQAQSWKNKLPEFPAYDAQGEPVMETYDEEMLGEDGLPNGQVVQKQRQAVMEITFRETGDAGALVDIIFGSATGADKNQAIASLVTTSVVNPPITMSDFQAMGLQNKFALFSEILTHVKKQVPKDFPGAGSLPGQKPAKAQTTPDGGSGAPQKSSASVNLLD